MGKCKNAFHLLVSWYIASLCKTVEMTLGLMRIVLPEPCNSASVRGFGPSLPVFLVRLSPLSCALLPCICRFVLLFISPFDQVLL